MSIVLVDQPDKACHPKPLRARLGFAAVAMVAALSLPAGVSGAQSTCLLGAALDPARVTISQPAADSTITGDLVVSGSASSGLPIDRIELVVGDLVLTQFPDPGNDVSFSFRVPRDDLPRGDLEFTVKACATLTLGAAGGSTSRRVTVADPPATTQAPTSTTQAPSTTDAPSATAAPSDTTSATTDSPGSESPSTQVPAPGLDRPLPVDAGDPTGESRADQGPGEAADDPPAASRPLVLSDAEEGPTDNGPLWVGLVVGLSGAAGLVISAARRRAGRPPVAEEDFFGDAEPDDRLDHEHHPDRYEMLEMR